jgi:rifampicin phosphotransferase
VVERYPDGRWWPNEHQLSQRFPVMCRGNTGEVYPNVVTPLTGSIVNVPFALGQRRCAIETGLATRRQLVEFDGHTSAMAANIAGYLYVNVSLARSATARTPGLTVDMVDRQMFGLSGAPAHRRGPGDRSALAALRAMKGIGAGVLRLDTRRLADGRALVDAFVRAAPSVDRATNEELLDVPAAATDLLERMMHDLLTAGVFAGVGRTMIERMVVKQGGDGLVNTLTAGLGTIESAQPAFDLWRLGRLVAVSRELTEMFDAGTTGLHDRIARGAVHEDVARFIADFEQFQKRHGARGPDEWELASPTWGSDPSIGLASVDRLRHAPADRDPSVVGSRLAAERERAGAEVRSRLGWSKRRPFDVGVRAASHYQAQREATKAAFVRLLDPIRRSLAELARRSAFSHDDFFLLTIDQVPGALADPGAFAETIAERHERRDYLQARVPPFWFEGEIPHPSTWTLRSELRRPDASPRVIVGLGVCSGVATGTAHVVTDPADPRDLEPGDILIAPITDPAWTPLFLGAAGVVVDVGAQMSHAAIVARELGIPAVVSATGASQTIPDGALVTVDGSAGTVTVHGADESSCV